MAKRVWFAAKLAAPKPPSLPQDDLGFVSVTSRGPIDESAAAASFPLLPAAFRNAGMLANSSGERVAVFNDRHVLLLDVNQTVSLEKTAQEGDAIVFMAQSGTSSPPWGGYGSWGLKGVFRGDSFDGIFVDSSGKQVDNATFSVKQVSTSCWRGPVSFGTEYSTCWPEMVPLSVLVDVSDNGKRITLGHGQLRALDPAYFGSAGQIKDVRWHSSFPDELYVLTSGKVRAYNLVRSFTKPAYVVDLNLKPSTAVRLGTIESENLTPQETQMVFVMYADGALDYFCSPSYIGPKQSLDDSPSSQQLSVFRSDRADLSAIHLQQFCGAPLPPDERYRTGRSGLSEAFDFCLSKIEDCLVFHRTWTCGRIDIVLCRSTESQDSVLSPAKPTSATKATIFRGAGIRSKLSRLPKNQSFSTKIVECATLWNRETKPFVYACGHLKTRFVVCDAKTGEVLFMKALWAEGGTGRKASIRLSILASVSQFSSKGCLAMAADPTGATQLVWKDHADHLHTVDIVRYDREWTLGPEVQRLAQINVGATDEISQRFATIRRSMESEKQLLTDLRTSLQAFIAHIPSDIGSIVVNKQPEDSADTMVVMEWLTEYYHSLTSTGSDGNHSVVAALRQLGEVLAQGLKEQREEVERQKSELDNYINLMSSLQERTSSMLDAKLAIDEHLISLRELAHVISKSKSVSQRIRRGEISVEQISRLKALRENVLLARERLQRVKDRLSQPSISASEMAQDSQVVSVIKPSRSSLIQSLQIGSIIERNEVAVQATWTALERDLDIHPVVLVAHEEFADALNQYDAEWRHDLKVGIKPRFFLERSIRNVEIQTNERRLLDRQCDRYLHIPLTTSVNELASNTSLPLVILGRDLQVKVGSRGHYYISRVGRIGNHVEIKPSRFESVEQNGDILQQSSFATNVLADILKSSSAPVDEAARLLSKLEIEMH